MHGEGTMITCRACGDKHELTETGFLKNLSGNNTFTHIPDWYDWQRKEVRTGLQDGTYSLDADYYWYEIGDMICIGNMKCLYYCFPKDQSLDVVAKTRIATEELYKMKNNF